MITALLKYVDPLYQLEKRRQEFIAHPTTPEWLKAIFSDPLPSKEKVLDELNILSIDFETSGLDPKNDQILSVGMVEINHFAVSLESSTHFYIAQSNKVKADTAVINHIVPQLLKEGAPLMESIKYVLQRCKNRVLLAHCAAIEQQFLQRSLPEGLPTLPIIWLDTLQLEKSLSQNRGRQNGDFRLSHIRQMRGLPDYPAHNALMDAIATAELFLVQSKQLYQLPQRKLGAIYKRCR